MYFKGLSKFQKSNQKLIFLTSKGERISQLVIQFSYYILSSRFQFSKMSSYTESRKHTIRRDIISVERKIQNLENSNNEMQNLQIQNVSPSSRLRMQRKIALNNEVMHELFMRLFSLKERLQLLEENHQVIEMLSCICDNIEMKRIFPTRMMSYNF